MANGDIRARLSVGNWIGLISLVFSQAVVVVGAWVSIERRVSSLEANTKTQVETIRQIQHTQATIAITANSTARLVDHLAEEVRDLRP